MNIFKCENSKVVDSRVCVPTSFYEVTEDVMCSVSSLATLLTVATTVSEGLFVKYLAIFFKEENVNQKYETHRVKSYFTKQLVFISM